MMRPRVPAKSTAVPGASCPGGCGIRPLSDRSRLLQRQARTLHYLELPGILRVRKPPFGNPRRQPGGPGPQDSPSFRGPGRTPAGIGEGPQSMAAGATRRCGALSNTGRALAGPRICARNTGVPRKKTQSTTRSYDRYLEEWLHVTGAKPGSARAGGGRTNRRRAHPGEGAASAVAQVHRRPVQTGGQAIRSRRAPRRSYSQGAGMIDG